MLPWNNGSPRLSDQKSNLTLAGAVAFLMSFIFSGLPDISRILLHEFLSGGLIFCPKSNIIGQKEELLILRKGILIYCVLSKEEGI